MENEIKGTCPICLTISVVHRDPSFLGGSTKFECQGCGPYTVTDEAVSEVKRSSIHRGFLSGSIRSQVKAGKRVILDGKEIGRIAALPVPSFKERSERYLVEAATKNANLNAVFDAGSAELLSAAYCSTSDELSVFLNYLKNEGQITFENYLGAGNQARLTARGHMAADQLRAARALTSQGFIAMWFDKDMLEVHKNGLEPGVKSAGYRPHRIDDTHHIDSIDDRIIAEIRRSRFVVADLTGHRTGVYYEAGFARGLEKPVFYTCRDDAKGEIHFDVRQFNCILWKKSDDLAEQLQNRIEAVLGAGPEHAA